MPFSAGGATKSLPCWRCREPTRGPGSTVNAARSNFAVVPVSADGKISIYVQAGGNAFVDVLGYFSPAPAFASSGRF